MGWKWKTNDRIALQYVKEAKNPNEIQIQNVYRYLLTVKTVSSSIETVKKALKVVELTFLLLSFIERWPILLLLIILNIHIDKIPANDASHLLAHPDLHYKKDYSLMID